MINKFSRLVLLVVASFAFVFGVTGALLFFPGDGNELNQAHCEGPQTQVSWQTSLAAGSTLAKQEHKYVLADVYTVWCGWCKRLDRDVFPDPKVVSYLQKDFVCVKVNAEEPKEGAGVAEQYKVDAYPCALVFSPDGKLIGRIEGYESPRGYIKLLKKITSGAAKANK